MAETTEGGKEAAEPQREGQQKWDGDADKDPMKLPPHGTEVFVGGIAPGTTEEDLKEALSSAGEIFSVCIDIWLKWLLGLAVNVKNVAPLVGWSFAWDNQGGFEGGGQLL
jgi:hypothetical protein